MAIRDRNIEYKRQKRVIPWSDFSVMKTDGSGNVLAGPGTGAPVANVISTTGLAGLSMEVGDEASAFDFQTPSTANIHKEIGVRVLYTIDVASPAATDSVTWLVKYDQVDPGEAIIKPATALNTTIAAQADGGTTGLLYRVSSRGIINADSVDVTAKTGVFSWLIEADAVTTYSAGESTFLGLEIDYELELCVTADEIKDVYKNIAASN